MRAVLVDIFDVIQTPILIYFLVINTSYLVLILAASRDFVSNVPRRRYGDRDDLINARQTPGVSIIVPAYNEAVGIVTSVQAMLSLNYARHEVVVVDDGSSDDTLAVLIKAFDLVEIPRIVPTDIWTVQTATAVYTPRDGRTNLTVVTKPNSGRSDAINLGINAASMEFTAFVDADSILDSDALLRVVRPFVEDPERVVAAGGVIRAVNDCTVDRGRVTQVRMPKRWLPRIQVVEYLRAFQLGRAGWGQFKALILISGAFGLYRRDLMLELGGLDAACIGEDFEFTLRVHRHMRDRKVDYRAVFVGGPVSWTEVPSTLKVLARQRRRWHRGLWEVLWKQRSMLMNPRYGRIGLIAIPYYWLFELIAPLLEFLGIILVPLGIAYGIVDATYALEFVAVAYVYAICVTLCALAIDEFAYHRYPGAKDIGLALLASIVENVGYRQLTAWWRIQGWMAALTGKKQVWGEMTRTGFASEVEVEERS